MIKLIMVIIIAILIYLSYEDVRTRTVQLKLLITAAVLAFVKASLYMLEYKVGIGIQLFLVTPGTIMLLAAVICRESNIGVGDGMTYIILGLMFGLSGYLVAVSVAFIISLATIFCSVIWSWRSLVQAGIPPIARFGSVRLQACSAIHLIR